MAKVKVAWRVVLSFLESVESERCWQELFSKTLLRLESIAPYDYALAAVSTAGCLVDSDNLVMRHIDDSLMDRYFNHFITIDPVLPLIPKLSGVTRLDWAVFEKPNIMQTSCGLTQFAIPWDSMICNPRNRKDSGSRCTGVGVWSTGA